MTTDTAQPTPAPLPEQEEFIKRALQSHALLIAGPGTGKTLTLRLTTERLAKVGEVSDDAIVLVTLTRAMAEKLGRIPHGAAGTLHSFTLSQLNRLGEASGRWIADEWEVENLVRTDLQAGVKADFGYSPHLRSVVKPFFIKLGAAFREGQEEPPDLSQAETHLFAVFKKQRELFRYRLLDELVYDLLRLLEEGAKLPSPPSHVLVDEYQDLTSGELRLLQVLAADYGSKILVCGDDRQSIFGFRAADERALHNFPGVYNVPPEYLSRSWRCPEAICVFAEEIAKVLPALEGIERPQLIPWPEGRDPGSIRVISAGSPRGEANWVISECARLITEEGIAPCDIMVIAASYFNQVFSSLKKAVESVAALPFEFYDPRGFSPAAGAVAVRLLRAGARLLQDADDQMAWRTLVWATKGLGPSRQVDILQAGQASYLQNLQSVAGHDKVCEQVLTAGKSLIEKYKEQEEVAAKDLVTFLADQVGRSGLDLESLSALPGDLGESAPVATWVQAVIELSQKTQVAPEDRPNDIPVRTILGAKGLEAPVVFLVSAIPQSFTKFGSVADGIRRLYVAITRTKDILYISAPRSLYKSGLGSAVESNYGGLEDSVTRTAELLGISVEKL